VRVFMPILPFRHYLRLRREWYSYIPSHDNAA
jgi:hypothetical protein